MNAPVPDPSRAASATATPLVVAHKFGGSSVADAERYRHVASLLRAQPETQQVAIVSAMKGVTDALIGLADAALLGQPWRECWAALREKHLTAARSIGGLDIDRTHAWLVAQFEELAALLSAIAVLGPGGEGALALVHGLGEVWSAGILGAALAAQGAGAAVLDAREVLVVGRNEVGIAVDWETSAARLRSWRDANPHARVVASSTG
jgi:aspartokinase/homoserine dehydrogenase 1